MRIAVIGGGIAGITAAQRLQFAHEVTLFEASQQLGGHAHAVEVEPGVFVDTGVIIFNQGSYPEFIELLKELGAFEDCFRMEMSISLTDRVTQRSFALGKKPLLLNGSLSSLLHPKTLKILRELWRFYRNGKTYLKETEGSGARLEALMLSRGYSPLFLDEFLFPFAMAIWSLPRGYFRDLDAEVFLRFLDHHRCLGGDLKNFRWYTFAGSTRSYIQKFATTFTGELVLQAPVKSVSVNDGGVQVVPLQGPGPQTFDHVVFATHADRALALLEHPSPLEQSVLGSWTYHTSKVFLHKDRRFAPAAAVTGSWNISYGNDPAQDWVTYDLNRIQRLKSKQQYYVTLTNGARPDHLVRELEYSHPVFDQHTRAKHHALRSLSDDPRKSYCGSYFGYGFHEDAIRSANQVAQKLLREDMGPHQKR